MPIHVEGKKVILEEDLVATVKLIGKNIKQDLTKDLRDLEVIRSYKALSSRRATHKHKKKMKHREFRVSSTIDE